MDKKVGQGFRDQDVWASLREEAQKAVIPTCGKPIWSDDPDCPFTCTREMGHEGDCCMNLIGGHFDVRPELIVELLDRVAFLEAQVAAPARDDLHPTTKALLQAMHDGSEEDESLAVEAWHRAGCPNLRGE